MPILLESVQARVGHTDRGWEQNGGKVTRRTKGDLPGCPGQSARQESEAS